MHMRLVLKGVAKFHKMNLAEIRGFMSLTSQQFVRYDFFFRTDSQIYP